MFQKFRNNSVINAIRNMIPNTLVNYFWHLPKAWLAVVRYGMPARKLKLIGVTGTDGKTTTISLINHILKTAGYKTVMISTVTAEINGKQSDTGFHVTSPDPFSVQKYLKESLRDHAEFAVLEVTSHALDQFRYAGCRFLYGVITNIRPDHLDYHKTYRNYLLAKAKLLKNARTAVLNYDDESFKILTQTIGRNRRITYSIKHEADMTPELLGLKNQPKTLPGDYNLSNILAAAAVLTDFGIEKNTILQAMKSFPGVTGRFQEITAKNGSRIIIDFAHTPYALKELLATLRAQLLKDGKLIAVFGCAAERGLDRRKMGQVSAELADITVITAEDPRFEGVENISNDIAAWAVKGGASEVKKDMFPDGFKNLKGSSVYMKIPDRQEAIDFAVKIAGKHDIVALCGKGHEKSMNFRGIEYPWDEQKAVQKAIGIET